MASGAKLWYTRQWLCRSSKNNESEPTMSTLLLVVIYICFIGLGLPDSLLGAAWPAAYIDLGVPVSAAGFASVVSTAGTVISSLLAQRLIKALGTRWVALISMLVTAAALFGMGFVQHYWVVLALAVPLGLGAGTIDAALNNFVALNHKAAHMNWLHCFWGVGATAGPAIMALYLAHNDWRGAYLAIALALFGISLVLALSLPLWKRVHGVSPAHENHAPVPLRALLRRPGAVFACLAFFIYCAAEYSTGLWASTYFVSVKGVSPDIAASWTSMYYLGITLGRLVSGFAAMWLSSRTLVRAGLGAALLGLAVVLALPGAGQLAGLLLVGLGCAPIFPSLLDQTPGLFGARYSQGMMGLQLASAYIGSTLMAPLFGWISPAIGLSSWPVYLLALFVLLIFSTERTHRAARKAA
jgi:fucose permease